MAPPVPSLRCFKVSPNRKQNENEILIFEVNHDFNLLVAKAKLIITVIRDRESRHEACTIDSTMNAYLLASRSVR